MITEAMLPEIKKKVGDYNNPIFQRYLKVETRVWHVCPVCELNCSSYKELYLHVHTNHSDKLDTPEVKEALDPLRNIKRLLPEKADPAVVTIGKFFGEKITSEHNQHVLVNLIGKTGMGKSNAAMRIGEETAKYIANIKGGDPSKYFNIDNIAIMRLDSVIPIIEDLDQKQYNIIVLDDIGASYSARDFNKAINKNLNKVFQTFRDTNTLVILTMPDTFLIDKVMRKLAHFQIEVVEARHDEGISVGKLFEVIEQYKAGGKAHYHYIVYNGVKYPRVVFKRASHDLVKAYEAKRKEIRKTMMAESIANIRTAETEVTEGKKKIEKAPKHISIANEIKNKLLQNPKISDRALSIELQTSRETIKKARQYINDNGLF